MGFSQFHGSDNLGEKRAKIALFLLFFRKSFLEKFCVFFTNKLLWGLFDPLKPFMAGSFSQSNLFIIIVTLK